MILASVMINNMVRAENEALPEKKQAPDFALKRFNAMDTDQNGAVSLEEFKAAHDKRIEEMKKRMGDKFDATKVPGPIDSFKKLDADANGSLSLEEYRKSSGDRPQRGKGIKDGKVEPKPAVEPPVEATTPVTE